MDDSSLAARFRDVARRVRAIAQGRAVTLIAVSKLQPVDAIEALYRLGHRDFGENYVQELVAKATELHERGCDDIRWHLIGHLQTNKVKLAIPHIACIHSVDSANLVQELAKRWRNGGRKGTLPVFIEVNIDREPEKAGVHPDQTEALVTAVNAHPELELQGLMCIPAAASTPEANRDAFRRLRALEAVCCPKSKHSLSMGMSEDYETAIQEGATHVRVGTALFGNRP